MLMMCSITLLASCNSGYADKYDTLEKEVQELKTKCSDYQKSIKHQNITKQDIDDRQYELDRMKSILHADERSLSSCLDKIKSYEAFVKQNNFDKTDENNLRTIFQKVKEINTELLRCSQDISSEGMHMTLE